MYTGKRRTGGHLTHLQLDHDTGDLLVARAGVVVKDSNLQLVRLVGGDGVDDDGKLAEIKREDEDEISVGQWAVVGKVAAVDVVQQTVGLHLAPVTGATTPATGVLVQLHVVLVVVNLNEFPHLSGDYCSTYLRTVVVGVEVEDIGHAGVDRVDRVALRVRYGNVVDTELFVWKCPHYSDL